MDNDSSTVTLSGEPFDPTKVDTSLPNVQLVFGPAITMPDIDEVGQPTKAGIVVQWVHNYSVASTDPSNETPDWANLPAYERIYMELDYRLVNQITSTRLSAYRAGDITFHYDLPCPPYTYEYEGANLRISKGPFSKSGNREEWEHVIQEMQEAVDGMPEGIDLNSATSLSVEIEVTVVVSKEVELTDLLEYNDSLSDDGLWRGDTSDLRDAIDEALGDYEIDDDALEYETCTITDIGSTRGTDIEYVLRSLE